MMSFRVQAFVCCFNEADILEWTLEHLQLQEVEAYVIDNWSTDGSQHWANERFPAAGPSALYEWTAMLHRIERLAATSKADWCMIYDADEIRRSRHPGETLRDALARFDRAGWTAADHEVFQFWPVDDSYKGDPERSLLYYERPKIDTRLPHIKAWKNTGPVGLAASAGHWVHMPDRRVAPEKLILKHYPIRTIAQAERKVLRDRIPRYDPAERAKNWHVQYDEVSRTREWIKRPETLTKWEGM